jgi:WD40 repeat protein
MTWKAGRWIWLGAAVAVLAAGCGSGNPPPAAAVTSTPLATSTPAPTTSLALVTLRGSNQVVVRDVTDMAHPKTLANLGTISRPQFVSATSISYIDENGDVVQMPLAGSPKTVVAKTSNEMLLTWSPDGRTVAYVSNGVDKSELHFITVGHDQIASTMAPFNGGCETQACGVGSDFRLAYSQDGKYISLTQPWGGPNFRLWTSDGKLLKSNDPGTSYAMSTWSGNSLYFMDPSGVSAWRNGVVSSFLPGASWIRPKGSPAGGQIVYAATDSAGWDHVLVVDTTAGKAREIKESRSEPVYLTSRYIWYQGERLCAPADNGVRCDGSLPVVASGTSYIYDLQDGTESSSLITSVLDVWPHAA